MSPPIPQTELTAKRLHAGLNAINIRAGIFPHEPNPGYVASDNTHEVKHGGKHGEAYDGRSDSGADEVPKRIDAHGGEGVNLFGDALDTDLRGDGRTRPGRNHDSGKNGPQFPDERQKVFFVFRPSCDNNECDCFVS